VGACDSGTRRSSATIPEMARYLQRPHVSMTPKMTAPMSAKAPPIAEQQDYWNGRWEPLARRDSRANGRPHHVPGSPGTRTGPPASLPPTSSCWAPPVYPKKTVSFPDATCHPLLPHRHPLHTSVALAFLFQEWLASIAILRREMTDQIAKRLPAIQHALAQQYYCIPAPLCQTLTSERAV
jgi:hypothetical protein